jgi:integrase
MQGAIRPLEDLYGGTRVADFGPLALKAVRLRMINAGLCRTEINRRINRIRRVFKWGVEDELVPANVLHALQAVAPLKRGRTIAPESEPVLPVPDADVDAVLPHVARQVAVMIQLQRLTAMRPGEVVLLRPCDVDRTGSVWIYTLTEHKTAYRGYRRDVYLGPQAQALLLPWLERDPQAYCFSPAEAEAERNALRRQNRQSPMTPSQARRRPKKKPRRAKRARYDVDSYHGAIDYGIKKAGVKHWHPHQLRHSCATRVRREYGR